MASLISATIAVSLRTRSAEGHSHDNLDGQLRPFSSPRQKRAQGKPDRSANQTKLSSNILSTTPIDASRHLESIRATSHPSACLCAPLHPPTLVFRLDDVALHQPPSMPHHIVVPRLQKPKILSFNTVIVGCTSLGSLVCTIWYIYTCSCLLFTFAVFSSRSGFSGGRSMVLPCSARSFSARFPPLSLLFFLPCTEKICLTSWLELGQTK